MADSRLHPILKYLRQVLGAAAGGGVSDADLLRRFVAERDEAAFELLLWRHAAMVLHVCRHVLGDADAAEDAFQATFLVFVRKAGSISRREALGSWLYRVAYRIALKARQQVRKRTPTAAVLDQVQAPAESDDSEQRELRRILCEEVDRLPAKYRAPIVACFFEGKTHEEAALQLGWPRGTVAGRVARARELLRRRLLRRGVTLTAPAFVAALSVRTAQAALARLVDSLIQIRRLLAAGQAASAVVSPHVAALAEGVLQAMLWTRVKIVVAVLLLAGVGGTGAALWARQRGTVEPPNKSAAPVQAPSGGSVEIKDEARALPREEVRPPEEAAQLARNMALSRVNLKKLALAMHNYNDVYTHLPLAATMSKDGKALLSWRVQLLPFLGEQALYNQFKHDEPWDSPHNKKLLAKMPAVYAPPGVQTRRPYSTYYQVFVSTGFGAGAPGMGGSMSGASGSAMPGGSAMPSAPGGMPGGAKPPGGGAPGRPSAGPMEGILGPRPGGPQPGAPGGSGPVGASESPAAFIKGGATRIPVNFPDGTSNTILIVEAGNAVPWTKPEDLHYADDEPLPELGGLFPDVFHAVFVDGKVHTLTKNYDEKNLRAAITASAGDLIDMAKIEGRSRGPAGTSSGRAAIETWQRKNEELRKDLDQAREQVRLLKEELEVQRELAGEDPRVNQLKEEHNRMQGELEKLRREIEGLKEEMRRPRKPVPEK
jgi:RNA polymerase sigma factor (sigma-70 family)